MTTAASSHIARLIRTTTITNLRVVCKTIDYCITIANKTVFSDISIVNGHLDGNQPPGLTSSQLPDLLSGTNDSNEQHTKEILKNLSNIQQQQQHHLFNNVHLQQQLNGLGLGNGGVESGIADDWEAAFSKYVIRKLDVEHHGELLRLQELQKRNVINNGLNGASQFNGFNGEHRLIC